MKPAERQDAIDRLVGDLRPVKVARFAGVYARCLTVWIMAILAALTLLGARPDVKLRMGDPVFWLVFAVTVAASLLTLAGAVALAFPDRAETRWRHAVWFAAVPPVLGVGYLLRASGSPMDVLTWSDARCGFLLLSAALFPLIVFVIQASRLAPFRTGIAAFGFGAAAFSSGVALLQWHCSIDGGFHAGLWHFLPVLPAALMAAAAVRRVLGRWGLGNRF